MNKKFIYIVIIIGLILLLYFTVKDSFKKIEKTEIKNVDIIEKYGYKLNSNHTSIYKEKFNELKEILVSDNINEEEYAKKISEMFAIDFFTLNNKIANTDIGGLDFIYEKIKDNLSKKARNTLYKNIQNNIYGDREQILPEVSETKVTSLKNIEYKKEELIDKNSYEIRVDIKYKKDLKYKENVTLTLIHDNEKLYIVEIK